MVCTSGIERQTFPIAAPNSTILVKILTVKVIQKCFSIKLPVGVFHDLPDVPVIPDYSWSKHPTMVRIQAGMVEHTDTNNKHHGDDHEVYQVLQLKYCSYLFTCCPLLYI